MESNKHDLSYFTLRLQEHLQLSFPELYYDRSFTTHRAQLAASAYQGAFGAGNQISQCMGIAEYILFEGLGVSRFDIVFRVICNEFDTLMADEELRPFALKMLPVCQDIFSRYDLSEEFIDGPGFGLLQTELTGTIQFWIEENGLQ